MKTHLCKICESFHMFLNSELHRVKYFYYHHPILQIWEQVSAKYVTEAKFKLRSELQFFKNFPFLYAASRR